MPPHKLHDLGPRQPAEPVARNSIGVRILRGPLITHDRIIEVLVEGPVRVVATAVDEAPVVPKLVKERLPGDGVRLILGPPVVGPCGRQKSTGLECAPWIHHHDIRVISCLVLCHEHAVLAHALVQVRQAAAPIRGVLRRLHLEEINTLGVQPKRVPRAVIQRVVEAGDLPEEVLDICEAHRVRVAWRSTLVRHIDEEYRAV
mmetsp:Transcript_21168/g.60185  ORF Transcript_21168/g.60185 Transcript_21168/m.60185 type:complete len:202 (+) Transcript_21168:622-1227(+)